MRHARAQDYRRRLITKEQRWRTRVRRFAFQDLPSLGSSELGFDSPISLLSGPNGVGKSTLLRALWATVDPAAAKSIVAADKKLTAGSGLLELTVNGVDLTAEVSFQSDEMEIRQAVEVTSVYIDSGSECRRYQEEFCKFESIEEITNGVAGVELKPEDVAEVNFIMKRDYRSIKLFEVEVGGDTPFFEVVYGDDRYDSRTMGTGEIAAFHLWWALTRSASDSLVCIEEPEAYLSNACQGALADFVIAMAVKKRLCCLISSHSPAFISVLPQQSLHFMSRGQDGVRFVGGDPHPVLLKSVGIDPPVRAALFVEDQAAKEFCKGIIERADPTLSRQVAIEVRGGEGEVTAALRLTGKFKLPMKFIGIYDGDVAADIPEDVRESATALPGDRAIEEIFRDMVTSNPHGLAEALNVPALIEVLHGLEGANCHDWFEQIAHEVGLTPPQLFPVLFRLWMSGDANSQAAAVVYENIVALIDGRSDEPRDVEVIEGEIGVEIAAGDDGNGARATDIKPG